jgi:hypothetical protein
MNTVLPRILSVVILAGSRPMIVPMATITKTEREVVVEPNCMTDHFWWKAVAIIRIS